ncbi:hypothetical protein BJV77DRAFT_262565 [Russula vinacea]|nr:hypothetical protein BJV77DRAFT_262565 [Russula vinacea]
MSEPYDPYLPRGGSSANPSAAAPGGSSGPNPKTAHIQAQIDDTVNIMRDNITKVVERQERLDSLQDKTGQCFFIQFYACQYCRPYWFLLWGCNHRRDLDAHASHCLPDNLAVSAQGFRRNANRVRKNMW